MRSIPEAALVAVVCLIVWLAIQGWFPVPSVRTEWESVRCRRSRFRLSLRGVFIAVGLVAIALGLAAWAIR